MRLLLLLLAVLGSSSLAVAQDHSGGADVMAPASILGVTSKDPTLSAEMQSRAEHVGNELVCLCGTCPRYTVATCDCGWAHASMAIIKNAVAKGKSEDEIKAAYEKVYGTKVYPIPPGALGDLTWLIPYAAALGGLAAFFAFAMHAVRRHRKTEMAEAAQRSRADAPADEDRERLRRELEDLD
jgi:cytochrome c-type biogenesis protein CcmH